MVNLIALFRLQQVDTQLEEFEKELVSLNGSMAPEKELLEAMEDFEKFKNRKREAERLLKDAELELATLESQKKTASEKLYGGKVTDSKELSQIEKDLSQLQKRQEKLDERVLLRMEQLESTERELPSHEATLEKAKAKIETAKAEHEKRKCDLLKQKEETEEKRNALAAALDPELLETYQNLKEKKGGLAVVKLNENNCGGCFMLVPGSQVQKVKAYELVLCSSCGRILVS